MQATTVLTLILAIIVIAYPISKKSGMDITLYEKRDALKIAKLFTKSFQETMDLRPIANELFVLDIIDRYLDDPEISLFLALERSEALRLNREEVRRYFIATVSFQHLSAKYFASRFYLGPGSSSDELPLEEIYPPSVARLLKSDPTIDSLIKAEESGGSRETKNLTAGQLRTVLPILEKAVLLMREHLTNYRAEGTRMYRSNMRYLQQRGDLMEPWVTTSTKESRGFPVGTRFININIPFHQLQLIRIAGQLKIISIGPYPD